MESIETFNIQTNKKSKKKGYKKNKPNAGPKSVPLTKQEVAKPVVTTPPESAVTSPPSSWSQPPSFLSTSPVIIPPVTAAVAQTSVSSTAGVTTPPKPTTTTTTTSSPGKMVAKRSSRVSDDDVTGLAVRVLPKGSEKQYPVVPLFVNQFQIAIPADKKFYQYQVEFLPPQDSKRTRGKIIAKVGQNVFGAGAFEYDGSAILYSTKIVENSSIYMDNVTISINRVSQLDPKDPKSAQLYNIIFKQKLKQLKLVMMGRQYYCPNQKIVFPKYQVELWPGYYTSINITENGLSLLCDLSNKIVRTTTCLEKINQMRDKSSLQEIENYFNGKIVITKYNNKTYRVNGVQWNMRIKDKMDSTRTFQQYYQATYPKEKINDLNQPLLEIKLRRFGVTETQYLIPELCFMTGIEDQMLKDFQFQKDLSSHKNPSPKDRKGRIEDFIKLLNKNSKASDEMNLAITDSCLQVNGYNLPKPQLNIQKAALKGFSWALIVMQRDQSQLDGFIQELTKTSGLGQPVILNPTHFNGRAFNEQIRANPGYKFYFLVIADISNMYDEIKQYCLTKAGVITQCSKLRTLTNVRAMAGTVNNFICQIAAKLGKAPWTLQSTVFNSIPTNKTMLIGIDVNHDTQKRGHSVVGVVSTLDKNFSLCHHESIVQDKPGKEIVESLEPAVKKCLQAYAKVNGNNPELIIVYRDGVGDGMINLVKHHEVAAIKSAIAASPSIYGRPKLVFTVVKKNTHTRFFTRNMENPDQGTVINSGCVHKDWYDFFLISHNSIGSIKPTHYHIIFDEAQIPEKDFQMFTYHNCFQYYNFSKGVSVPSVCQYSHKLAFLVGKHVHTSISNNLSTNLCFL